MTSHHAEYLQWRATDAQENSMNENVVKNLILYNSKQERQREREGYYAACSISYKFKLPRFLFLSAGQATTTKYEAATDSTPTHE